MSDVKLKRCPFCGGEAKYKKHYREDIYHGYLPVMKCESCGAIASLTDSDIGNYEEILTRKWNTRKPMQDIVERLEEKANELRQERHRLSFAMYSEEKAYNNMKKLTQKEIGMLEAIEIVKEVGGMNE